MSKVICSNCGAEVQLPKISTIALGRTVSEQGNDTYVLEMKKKENKGMQKNAESRKVVLEVNGVDTNGYFALTLPNGVQVKLDAEGNKVDSEVLELIGDNIANTKLYRRWVMAQWFRQYNHKNGYAYAVSHIPFNYQWKMIQNELEDLSRLEKKDKAAFEERTYFFSIRRISQILNEWVIDIENKVKHAKIKKCKGIPYVHIGGKDVFLADMNKKVYVPIRNAISKFETSPDYRTAYVRFCQLKREYLEVYKTDRKYIGKVFMDTYKGAGAYYTLQNMVLYHGCKLGVYEDRDYYRTPHKFYSGAAAYDYMKSLLGEYWDYQWVGMLRQCIDDNHFSFGTTA